MNTERLLKLADFLESVPPSQFDMKIWGTDQECASAVAVVWACQVPEFKDAGLMLVEGVNDNQRIFYPWLTSMGDPRFCDSTDVIEEFFGLEYGDQDWVKTYFYRNDLGERVNPTPHTVAAVLRKLVVAGSLEAAFPDEKCIVDDDGNLEEE